MRINDIQELIINWRYPVLALTCLIIAWAIWRGILLNKPKVNNNSRKNDKQTDQNIT